MRLKDRTLSANTGLDAIKRAPIVEYDTGLKCIRIQDISQGKIYDEWGFTETNEKDRKKFLLKKNDLLIARTGATVGVSQFIKEDTEAVYNNGTIRLRLEKSLNPRFVYYIFQTKGFLQYIDNISCVATQPNLRIEGLLRFTIPDYSIEKQNAIVKTLSTFDDLIENNNKRIKLLEQIAENLYKEWFVRFRFPGYEDVEFENGLPKEWKICRIDQLSKIKAGGDAPDDSTKEVTNECSIPIYSNGIENEGLYGYTSKAKINKPSISISARGTVGYTCLRRIPYTPIVRLICIIPHENKLANWLFYYFKRTIVIASGTSQQQITIPMMSREKVLLPTNDLIQKFYEYSTCYLDEIDSLKAQNSNLEKQRDLLLPRLISGKLEV